MAALPPAPYHLPPLPPDWRQAGWPEVSVSVVTYNQVKLIGRALDSILVQEVDFPYEIVIGDDASTDGTREVLLDYHDRHPDLIRLRLYDKRQAGIPGRINNMENPRACRGKYTALLDGDDYWTDPHKLRDQYWMMEAHPELSICLHDTECHVLDAEGNLLEPPFLRSKPAEKKFADGFYDHAFFCADRNIRVHTSSFFFRTRVFGDWPPGYERVVAADHYLFLLISQRGWAHYDGRVRSVYEQQADSLTRGETYLSEPRLLQRLEDLRTYRRQFPATQLTASYSTYAARIAKQLLMQSIRRKDWFLAKRMLHYLRSEPRGVAVMAKDRVRKAFTPVA
jgi:glycosyltransferase involved in cell wall biosynthesis